MKSGIQRNIHLRCGVAVCLAAMCMGAVAGPVDSAGAPVYTLSGVKVSATHVSSDVRSAAPVQTLNEERMRREGVVDIGDALSHLAGLTLRDYGGAGGVKTVSVRGLGAAHTGVAYDGVMLGDAQTGQVDFSRFSLDGLSEISLAVGDRFDLSEPARAAAASANVSISSFCNNNPLNTSFVPQRSLHLEQGSFERYGGLLKWSQRLSRRFGFSAMGNYLFAGNNYPYTLVNGITSTREHRNNSRMNSVNGEVNTFWNLRDKESLETKVYYYDNNHHLPGVVTFYNPYNAEKLHERNLFGQARWRKSLGKGWTAQAIGKYNWAESKYEDRNGIYSGGVLQQNYWQREAYASGLLSYEHPKIWGVSYGADYFFNSMNSNQKTNADVGRHSFLQSLTANYRCGHLMLSGRLLASVYANRADGVEAAKDFVRLSPSAAVSWQVLHEKILFVRAFYKDIFRVPTFTESYYYHLGNADLRPERTHQYGVGVTFQKSMARWWPEMRLTADGYLNHVRDKIVSIPYNLYIWRTLNMGRVDIHGLDITLLNRFCPGKNHLVVLSGNFTLQSVKDKSEKGGYNYNKQLAYTPKYSGALSVAYENPWLNVSLTGCGASNRYSTHEHSHGTQMKGYMEFGTSVWRGFHLAGIALETRADVQNLFDKQYDIVSGYPMPGRAYRLSVTIKF